MISPSELADLRKKEQELLAVKHSYTALQDICNGLSDENQDLRNKLQELDRDKKECKLNFELEMVRQRETQHQLKERLRGHESMSDFSSTFAVYNR